MNSINTVKQAIDYIKNLIKMEEPYNVKINQMVFSYHCNITLSLEDEKVINVMTGNHIIAVIYIKDLQSIEIEPFCWDELGSFRKNGINGVIL